MYCKTVAFSHMYQKIHVVFTIYVAPHLDTILLNAAMILVVNLGASQIFGRPYRRLGIWDLGSSPQRPLVLSQILGHTCLAD